MIRQSISPRPRWQALAAAALLMLPGALSAQSYSLSGQWQDVTQPTSQGWSYRQGTTALPWQAAWTGSQGAYAYNPAATAGCVGGTTPFLPAAMRVSAGSPMLTLDLLAGDVVVHSVDACNGALAGGEASIVWTSAINGTLALNGSTWATHGIGRSSLFDLTIVRGGTTLATLASGSFSYTSDAIAGTTATSRAKPLAFSASNVAVQAGDQVIWRLRAGSGFGDFAGVRLDITATPTAGVVPEPSTYALFATGLAGLLLMRRRRAA